MKASVTLFLAIIAILGSQVKCSDDSSAPTANGKTPVYSDEEEMKTSDKNLKHQSPIDIRTKGWRKKREMFMVSGDEAFSYRYGSLQYSDAVGVGPHGVMFKI